MNQLSRTLCSALAVVAIAGMIACKSGNAQPENSEKKDTVAMKTDTGVFDHMLVDNLKDPSCGMPISAGLGDTAHYKDHVLGFCSKECKAAFEKNPEAMLAAADIKKK